jgi:hypothetical protein
MRPKIWRGSLAIKLSVIESTDGRDAGSTQRMWWVG